MSKRVEFWTPAGGLTARVVSDMLDLTGVHAPEQLVQKWTETERLVAYDWAAREHLAASDNPVRRRPRPYFLGGVDT